MSKNLYTRLISSLYHRAHLDHLASPDATAPMVYLEEEDHRGKMSVDETHML